MYVKALKPFFDFFFSLLVFPFVIFIILIFGLLIKLEDGGKVFHISQRLGRNGKPFKMYKLRSMRMNSEDIRNADGTTFSSKDDPRLTRVGRFIRSFSIDEIPQFINVLLFQMSLIGPRPDPIEWYQKSSESVKVKYSVKPGISGYTQAYFRNTLPLEKKNENEIFYARNISLWLDIKIFIVTIWRILSRKNVYRDNFGDENNGKV